MKKLLLFLMLTWAVPSTVCAQIQLKNLSFRKTHDLTWDVSWKVDVINRGDRAVRVWLDFQFIDKNDFAVATDNGEIRVASGDSITYREVRAFTPATYEKIASMNAKAEVRRLFLSASLSLEKFPAVPSLQGVLEVGDRFHIAGCENGELQAPVVHIWSQPTIAMGGRIIGRMSGGRLGGGVGQCLGSVVITLDIRIIGERTHIKIESVVNGTIGWITDSFVGKKFDTDRCREHFTGLEHIRRCEICESVDVKAPTEWIGSPTRNVNIRIGPGVDYPLHESGELFAGEEIQILQECQGWLQARSMPEHLIDRAIEQRGRRRARAMLLFWVRKDLIRRKQPSFLSTTR